MRAIDLDTERAIRAFLARIPSSLRIDQALLYGSRARGDYGIDSDTDVALIIPSGAGDWRTLWMLSGLAYEVFIETGILIQPVPIASHDWANPEGFSRPSFLRNVTREGIRL